MIFKQYTLNGKRRVSNGKCHVIKRKQALEQTREKVCGLCLNANSCILFSILYLSNCLIRCVYKKSFLSFSYFFMVIKKNMQNQNKFVGNSQSFAPPLPLQLNFCHCICVAIFIILKSQSEKLWDQNYKLRPQNYKLHSQNYKLRLQNYKLRSQNYKLRSQNYKLRVQNLQV